MRLIDADELKETLHETIEDDPRVKWWYDLIGVDDAIEDAPTIDHVKHGRWNGGTDEDKEEVYICSRCGELLYWKANYCPNCGARMDGGTDNEID